MKRGIWRLSLRRVRAQPLQTGILALCIAVSIFLPVETRLLVARYERELTARARATPMLAGPAGNRFDLALTSLYFRASTLATYRMDAFEALASTDLATVIPLRLGCAARGHALVGTDPEYYRFRGLVPRAGTLPLRPGDIVLGAAVADALDLAPGDTVFSDQRELYDIAQPPALKMRVTGVLARRGTPDDDAIFTDLMTTWIIDGLAHGHGDVTKSIDPALVLARSDDRIAVSGAFIEYNEVTPDTLTSLHLHVDHADLPLSAAIVVPRDAKAGTMLKARVNAQALEQMIVPTDVIADLLAYVFRVQAMLDGLSAVLAACTLLLTGLVMLLSTRLRAREMQTLHRIGAGRFTVARLYATELLIILVASLVLAGTGILVAQTVLPNLVFMLAE
ncbi:MAG: hypothetical protein KDA25_06305 [Phycisphaerales bacterium]|nr:hypothetical protein [Phycisphaerales bacterium]